MLNVQLVMPRVFKTRSMNRVPLNSFLMTSMSWTNLGSLYGDTHSGLKTLFAWV